MDEWKVFMKIIRNCPDCPNSKLVESGGIDTIGGSGTYANYICLALHNDDRNYYKIAYASGIPKYCPLRKLKNKKFDLIREEIGFD